MYVWHSMPQPLMGVGDIKLMGLIICCLLSVHIPKNYVQLCSKPTSKTHSITLQFLQRVSIAMLSAVLAVVNPSVCPSVTRWHCVKMTQATITGSSL